MNLNNLIGDLLSQKVIFYGNMLLEDWLLSLMSTLVMGFGPED
jgi:hypothetical protein